MALNDPYSKTETDSLIKVSEAQADTKFERILNAIQSENANLSERLIKIETTISFTGWFIPLLISVIIGVASVVVVHYWH